MAKKQSASEAKPEAEVKPDAAPSPAAPDAKPAKPEKAERKKAKSEKAPVDKASPAAPPAESAPPALAPSAGPAAAPSGEPQAKKKGRAPGRPPARGKKLRNHLRNVRQRIAKDGALPIAKAVGLLKSIKRGKFDETVEIHMSLGVNVSQAEQLVRGTVPLPHGIGKSVRVAVFCQGDNVQKAKDAGADAAGGDDLIEKIQKQNWMEFDVALATQDMMGKVSRLGKTLGPRGLMPTPKAGTVITTGDVGQAIREFKAGKVEFRTDKGGNVHAGVGKISFEENKLVENINTFVDAIRAAKPTGVKGNYIESVTLCSTMSPGVPVAL